MTAQELQEDIKVIKSTINELKNKQEALLKEVHLIGQQMFKEDLRLMKAQDALLKLKEDKG